MKKAIGPNTILISKKVIIRILQIATREGRDEWRILKKNKNEKCNATVFLKWGFFFFPWKRWQGRKGKAQA